MGYPLLLRPRRFGKSTFPSLLDLSNVSTDSGGEGLPLAPQDVDAPARAYPSELALVV